MEVNNDLTKIPSELKLYKKGEKKAYYRQFIEKELKPEILKNFIDVDQLGNLSYYDYEDMCNNIKKKAFRNVVSKLLEDNVDITKFPVTEEYVNENNNLREKINIINDNYEISDGSFYKGELGDICYGLYLMLLNNSGKRKGEFFLEFHLDDNGLIDKVNIIKHF